jgi:sugar phosphate isomerase/epimerase
VKPQAFRERDRDVVRRFLDVRGTFEDDEPRLKFAWSNWGFGTEKLERSAARLDRHGVRWIELHGNLYGPDLGYRADEVRKVLADYGIAVAGICGMVTPEQEFASSSPIVRQRAIDYFRRQIEFCREIGGTYVLFGAGAVGRPVPYDANELERAAETMRIVAEDFERAGIRGAVEPIRPEEVSVCHTLSDARRLIELINRPGVSHIAADLYHMLSGEEHIGLALLEHDDLVVNVHVADTNRRALGSGLLDLDIVMMALYAIGYQRDDRFCTAEPLGPGADPYDMMFGSPDPAILDDLVGSTARCFHEREEEILAASDEELAALYGLESRHESDR